MEGYVFQFYMKVDEFEYESVNEDGIQVKI